MKFSEIPGQEAIKDRLRQTVISNRVSHAQLFLGPSGNNKLALALAYAQFINCTNRSPVDSCGSCPSCIKYDKLAHPDLHFIYPVASTKSVPTKPQSYHFAAEWRKMLLDNQYLVSLTHWIKHLDLDNKQPIINTEDCSEIVRTLAYKSYESEYKVLVIWMADKLHHAAAPKLLKTLEEPPEKTLFLLISENQDVMLSTILSRTQIVKIPRYSDDETIHFLQTVLKQNPERSRQMAMLADGNLILATDLLQHTEEAEWIFVNFRQWMRYCFSNDIEGVLKFVAEVSKIGRERQKSFMVYALRVAQYSMYKNLKTDELVRSEGEEATFLSNFYRYMPSSSIQSYNKEFQDAHYHIERNGNASIIFTDLSLKIIRLLHEAKQLATD